MRRLYSAVLYAILPFALLRLVMRAIRSPAYLRRWGERFGYFPARLDRPSLWIHAVSVGEAISAFPLVERLKASHPDLAVVVTTTTPTGSARVTDRFAGSVWHGYLPYDLPSMVRRFLDRIRPQVAIVMETEIWPNLYAACNGRGIPILLVNARLSARSAAGYRRIRRLVSETLRHVTTVAAQTEADARRFIALGARPECVRVAGNIKFDVEPSTTLREQAAALRESWGVGDGRTVWIAASTHEGEEEQILGALLRLEAGRPLLVLVPRHPERFDRVASLCESRSLRVARRTQSQPPAGFDVFLGDTMGELPLFYAASDVAFVGGSLVAAGGHNLLEPAALGLPILFGPYVSNFEEISRQLLTAGGAVEVGNAAELSRAVGRFAADEVLRRETGARARAVVEANRGAIDRIIESVETALGKPGTRRDKS
jgi:3-deoxy-D-manno-octulosonic-acid transferase